MTESDTLAVTDHRARLHAGLVRAGVLLTPGERHMVAKVLALPQDAAAFWARLTARRRHAWLRTQLVDTAGESVVAYLEDQGFLTRAVPWATRCAYASRAVLVEGCRALGRPTTGRRNVLQERLEGCVGWSDRVWLGLRHRGLMVRLERWATLQPWPDRGREVAVRLGHITLPTYTRTTGRAIAPTRADWQLAEHAIEGDHTLEEALALLEAPVAWPPGRLNRVGALQRIVLEGVRQLERQGDYEEAIRTYENLLSRELVPAGDVLSRLGIALDRAGRPREAVERLKALRDTVEGPLVWAVERTGRRLARKAGVGWAPLRPLRPPSTRELRLQPGTSKGARPTWAQAGQDRLVEDAVAHAIRAHGRVVLRGEGRAWRTLLSLLLTDASFCAVPGALPVPGLRGPLDRWTPAFAARRAPEIFRLMDAIRQGQAPEWVARLDPIWRGISLSGARWSRHGLAELLALASAPPRVLRAVFSDVLARGRGAWTGFPDLTVLPGQACRLSEAFPASLSEDLIFVEVKGPGDTLRDAQRVWMDRLRDSGAKVEVWDVQSASS